MNEILQSMLSNVQANDPTLDIREGGIIYNALAPIALELYNYVLLVREIMNETFADTASRVPLIRRAAERGLVPLEATEAVGTGQFTPDILPIPIGSRFTLGSLTWKVTAQKSAGLYTMACETAGTIGNNLTGRLIPVEAINGLQTAMLISVDIPGEDPEDTETFRRRYFQSLQNSAFGGNRQDYMDEITKIAGVGGVKLTPTFAGGYVPSDVIPPEGTSDWIATITTGTPEQQDWLNKITDMAVKKVITVGAGTVRGHILSGTYDVPTAELINNVQTIMDPEVNGGQGYGLAPIGHLFTAEGATATTIDCAFTITYQAGQTWDNISFDVLNIIDAYFLRLAQEWQASGENGLVVRISQLESDILAGVSIVDIQDTLLNGEPNNVTLDKYSIPKRGAVSG